MPITEASQIDERTDLVRQIVEWVKDLESTQQPYRQAHEAAVAEAAAKTARRERMIRISKSKKGMKFPGSRPWQAAGFASRQAWLDHIDAQAQQPPQEETQMEA